MIGPANTIRSPVTEESSLQRCDTSAAAEIGKSILHRGPYWQRDRTVGVKEAGWSPSPVVLTSQASTVVFLIGDVV